MENSDYQTTYDRIIEIIKAKESHQGEIKKQFEDLSLATVQEHLNKALKNRVVGYIGKTIHSKLMIDERWTDYVRQYYVYTPESGKLYAKLNKKFKKNEQLVNEITELFRVIEIASKIQYAYFNDGRIIKRMLNSKNENVSDGIVSDKILLSKKDVYAFYRKRHRIIKFHCSDEKVVKKLHLFLDTMPPLMLWVAYKEIPLSEHPNYNPTLTLLQIF